MSLSPHKVVFPLPFFFSSKGEYKKTELNQSNILTEKNFSVRAHKFPEGSLCFSDNLYSLMMLIFSVVVECFFYLLIFSFPLRLPSSSSAPLFFAAYSGVYSATGSPLSSFYGRSSRDKTDESRRAISKPNTALYRPVSAI